MIGFQRGAGPELGAMYYVYCLHSQKNSKFYIGYTADLRKRVKDHNDGIGGDFTSKNGPWKLVYYEAFFDKTDAGKAEKYYKTGFGRSTMQKKLSSYLETIGKFGDRSA